MKKSAYLPQKYLQKQLLNDYMKNLFKRVILGKNDVTSVLSSDQRRPRVQSALNMH